MDGETYVGRRFDDDYLQRVFCGALVSPNLAHGEGAARRGNHHRHHDHHHQIHYRQEPPGERRGGGAGESHACLLLAGVDALTCVSVMLLPYPVLVQLRREVQGRSKGGQTTDRESGRNTWVCMIPSLKYSMAPRNRIPV